jgi:hypothetical protein
MDDTARAYELMLRICGVGIVVDSLERLTSIAKYRTDGLFSWNVLRQRLVSVPPPIRRLTDLLMAGTEFLGAVLLLRIAAAVIVALRPLGSAAGGAGLTLLVLGQIYVLVRTGFGAIGADPMTLVVCGGAWLAAVVGRTPLTMRAGLWFIALQGCLGYAVAGVFKLIAPKWRSGEAMMTVMSTSTYGNRTIFGILKRRPWLSRFACWLVIVWEATFPLVLIGPDDLLVAQFALGLLFHASIASLMGLNLFLAAFPTTYVAIWAIRH